MVGGIFYEHGHRLIASGVGFLTIVLALWIWRAESPAMDADAGPRRAGRRFPAGRSRRHHRPVFPAYGGVDRARRARADLLLPDGRDRALHVAGLDERQVLAWLTIHLLRLVATTTTAFIYLQIIVGATMRHSEAGLAIPDFPLVFGGIVPPAWTPQIAIHYAHRVGALIVTLGDRRNRRATSGFTTHSAPSFAGRRLALACLVLCTGDPRRVRHLVGEDVAINTAHVVVGALTLASSLVLTLRSHRVRFGHSAAPSVAAATHRRLTTSEARGVKDASASVPGQKSPRAFRRRRSHRLADFVSPDQAAPQFSRRRYGGHRVLPWRRARRRPVEPVRGSARHRARRRRSRGTESDLRA